MNTRDNKFLRHFSMVSLILSAVFMADLALPISTKKAEVISTHRPKTKRNTISDDEVIVQTTEGLIKVRPRHLGMVASGDSVLFHKSMLMRVGKAIHLKRQDRLVATSNFVYSWFLFMPVLIIILSVITITNKHADVVHNIGGANLAITLFVAFVLIKDYFR